MCSTARSLATSLSCVAIGNLKSAPAGRTRSSRGVEAAHKKTNGSYSTRSQASLGRRSPSRFNGSVSSEVNSPINLAEQEVALLRLRISPEAGDSSDFAGSADSLGSLRREAQLQYFGAIVLNVCTCTTTCADRNIYIYIYRVKNMTSGFPIIFPACVCVCFFFPSMLSGSNYMSWNHRGHSQIPPT